MKYLVLALVAGIIAIFLWGMSTSRAPAADGLVCDETRAVLKDVQKRFQEAPMFVGKSVGGGSLVMTMGANGTWSLFLAQPGKLCAIATGQMVAQPDPKPKTSAPMLLPNGLRLIRG